jgi:hypothetical protein
MTDAPMPTNTSGGVCVSTEDRPARRGDWLQTFTGRAFYPLDPRPEDIDPVDVAHALSLLCRYGGHSIRHYSVAEHCVLMSHAVAPENALWALLHDATEAYLVDIPRPLKSALPEYHRIEDRLTAVIADRFRLPAVCPDEVRLADSRILLDERATLMATPPQPWAVEHLEPLGVEICCWTPEEAEHFYLNRLKELVPVGRAVSA